MLAENEIGLHKRVHTLKVWPEYWDALMTGVKRFEVRRDDRGFQRGDILRLLRCHKPLIGGYEVELDFNGKPSHVMDFHVDYILTGGQFGVEPGFVIMSITRVNPCKLKS